MKYSEAYRRSVVERYEAKIRAGANVATAAKVAGHSSTTIQHWRDALAESDTNADQRHVAKRRECLRCGRGFRSSWAGNRICDRCKDGHALDGLPTGFAETPTEYVAS